MTITSPYTPASFNGSGTTGPFSFTFPIRDKAHIKVEKIVGTTVTTLTEGGGAGQYSIVLVAAGISGGQITLGTALAVGERLVVSRVTPRTQLEKLADLGRFNAEIHERAFDKATMVIQEIEYQGSAAVKFPTSDTPGLNQTLPVEGIRANKIMGFNSIGEPTTTNLTVSNLDNFNTALADAQSAASTALAQANISTTKASEASVFASQAAASASGMKLKTPARAATTGALPSSNYSNGASGVGATITATVNGAWSSSNSDGVSLLIGETLLVKNEPSSERNGIYILTQQGTAGSPWVLTRQTDSDTWAKIVAALVIVMEGSVNADVEYLCTSNSGGTMGSTAITWQARNSVIADGAVSNSSKILDGIILFSKLSASAIAGLSDWINGTVNKLLTADQFLPALSEALGYKKTFTSAEQTITSGGSLALPHGLPTTPVEVFGWLVCKTAEGGYSVNDIVPLTTGYVVTTASTNSIGFGCSPDATNINLRYGTLSGSVFSIINKTTGANFNITPGNWRLVVRARG